MKKIVSIITLIIVAISFSACGGGGSGDASFKESAEKIEIDISCTITAPSLTDINSFITLESGDSIVKESATSSITVYHDADGNKKICLVSGSAHIIRG